MKISHVKLSELEPNEATTVPCFLTSSQIFVQRISSVLVSKVSKGWEICGVFRGSHVAELATPPFSNAPRFLKSPPCHHGRMLRFSGRTSSANTPASTSQCHKLKVVTPALYMPHRRQDSGVQPLKGYCSPAICRLIRSWRCLCLIGVVPFILWSSGWPRWAEA